jgi:hypothetical protein
LPGSPVGVIVRLMIAEGPTHPDLVLFYWDNVVSRGLAMITELLQRGVRSGEFRDTAVARQPILFVMPVLVSIIFTLLFGKERLDSRLLIETQIDLLITHLKGHAS